ncbi:DUF47 domain-containing protein [Spirochaeta isovalerica]|uniref:Uncharacterized protein n=1 Tax=Spirochaeta isovalerica TaxID=150 RepID=A0A841RIQ0_9SPIO|nr:DUF47 family protein [Spirochaeta isovalerica]MBB6482182.1 hypothetical protein [Spirochaeta isovalerica]
MLFNRAKSVEANIEKFLENILKASLIFEQAIKDYFDGNMENFDMRKEEISKLESESDSIRRDIKHTLYKELLIPESRGDVLGLLESLDDVIDTSQNVLVRFSIEKPKVWNQLKDDFIELSAVAAKSVEEIVSASRAFFRETTKVPEHLVKVHFHEHEADKIEVRIMKKAFDGDFIEKFSEKVHMRYFAERISLLADESETVADKLDIYTIKRSI